MFLAVFQINISINVMMQFCYFENVFFCFNIYVISIIYQFTLPQRQGCIHGEDLAYMFGAPLIGGFSHFSRNYTKSEVLLSEAVMLYWSNFVRTG